MENSLAKISAHAELSLEALSKESAQREKWDSKTAPCESDLKNLRVKKAMAIIRDVEAMPKDWPQSQAKWIKFIATKNDISVRTVRRTLARDLKFGVAGHRHTKNRQKLKVPKEARDFAVGIVCKREHRRFTIKEAHELYKIEAQHKGWPEISYSFMTCLCREYLNASLKAYRDGGRLALDNLVRPIMRTYANLDPLQIIVADQHKMDVWVQDEETGEVFRPMIYMCQDLRTRMIVGLSMDKHSYNASMIGSRRRLFSRIRRRLDFGPINQHDITYFFRSALGVKIGHEVTAIIHRQANSDWRPVLTTAIGIERAMKASNLNDVTIEMVKDVLKNP
jgi:hypothetical protein